MDMERRGKRKREGMKRKGNERTVPSSPLQTTDKGLRMMMRMMMVLMVLMNDDGKGDVVRSGNCFPMRRMEDDTYTTYTPCVRSSRTYMIRFRGLLFQVRGQARLYRAA